MYSIEYYKSKRTKPTLEESTYSGDRKKDIPRKRKYLHQKDLIDKCWNIKSITIDLEDIKHIIHDTKLKYLLGLYARVNRINSDNSINSITILNNNNINLSYIYEILNCEWMVNREEEPEKIDALKISRKLCERIKEYERASNPNRKKDIEILIDYYMNTIINKYNNKQENKTRTLKLGNHWIREKKRTTN